MRLIRLVDRNLRGLWAAAALRRRP